MQSIGPAGRRQRIADRWLAEGVTEPVLVPSGLALPIAGTDQFHEFHAHPEFRYLAGVSAPASVLTFDRDEGWMLFVHTPTRDERVWSGDGPPLTELAIDADGVRIAPDSVLDEWLEVRRGRSFALAGNPDLLRKPLGYGLRAWPSYEIEFHAETSEILSQSIAEARRAKDPDELANMRAAAEASLAGHLVAMTVARAGMTERMLQVELEAAFARAGSLRTAYGSIIGTGSDAAVLHFTPGDRPLRNGELVLIDAAAEWNGYAADITRTFPVSGRFDGLQRDIYQLVLDVQQHAIERVRPGVEYRELHLRAAFEIADGLAQLDILHGDPESLVEQDAHAVFFPHGLGHMLGLSTHDAGGCLAGRAPSDRFGLKWLRADLPLEQNYVVTIEPGIYFIPALLTDPEWRDRHRNAINWPRVDALLDFGGVRIEDDVRVTGDGAEVLSAGVPKSAAAIEEIRREALSQ